MKLKKVILQATVVDTKFGPRQNMIPPKMIHAEY